ARCEERNSMKDFTTEAQRIRAKRFGVRRLASALDFPSSKAEASLRTPKRFARILCASVVILLLLFGIQQIAANEDRLREAGQFFEAKEYNRSLEIYDTLLETPLTPWQKAVVRYNIGCALLAQDHTTQAVQQFLGLPLSDDPNYLIPRR